MMNIQKAIVLSSLPFAAALLAGCLGSAEPTIDGADILAESEGEGEDVGEAELQLGELGCTVVAPDASRFVGYCSATSATSPDASYDHGVACPNQYVAKFTPVNTSDVVTSIGWADVPAANATECANMHIDRTIYRYPNQPYYPWPGAQILITKYHGEWVNGACSFKVDPGSTDWNHFEGAGGPVWGPLIWVAASAYSTACSASGCVVTKKKVRVSMMMSDPC